MTAPPAADADSRQEVESLNRRAYALRHRDARAALVLSRQAQAMALRLDDQRGLAYALLRSSLCLGIVAGDGAEVRSLLEQALGLMRGLGDRAGEAEALNHAGNLCLGRDDHDGALAHYRAALSLRESVGDIDGQAASLNNIGLTLRRADEPAEALQALFRGEDLARQAGRASSLAYLLTNIGQTMLELGDAAEARRRFDEGLALVRGTDDRALESSLLLAQGRLLRQGADPAQALPLLESALALAQATGNQGDRADALLELGELHLQMGRPDLAAPLLGASLDLATQRSDRTLAARALLAQARAWVPSHAAGASAQPRRLLCAALEQAVAAQSLALQAQVHECLSDQAERDGDLAAALKHSRAHRDCMARLHSAASDRRLRAVLTGRAVASERAEARDQARSREELLAELQAQTALLQQLAREDGLTGIANRRWLDLQCQREIERAHRFGHPMTLAMIDIDRFKAVNDRHGHAVGDQVLCATARLLREGCRGSDEVGRYGGEEFALILVEMALPQARLRAEHLRQRLAGHDWPRVHAGLEPITVSIGLAELEAGDTVASLQQRADAHLYRAKEAGRNRVAG